MPTHLLNLLLGLLKFFVKDLDKKWIDFYSLEEL